MHHLTPGENFVLGLVIGVALVALWFGIPALWWVWHDHRLTVALQPTLDELLDLDRCDICGAPLTDDVVAITCDAHRYCGDCDDASNRCTACAYERRLVLAEERA
ncbi:hypothetical protein [Nocardioides sp. SYSU D00065]|uniref:hypothetical protein n=1 Tax=Nocardioides sp. SYSU D00065 TaxID=2817378 RepID=UPI001B32833F|nr:hypothetical protein [Nocardioides sp. SYSU D00065]